MIVNLDLADIHLIIGVEKMLFVLTGSSWSSKEITKKTKNFKVYNVIKKVTLVHMHLRDESNQIYKKDIVGLSFLVVTLVA